MTDPLAPPTPLAALLFDCDGALVDTMPAYERAWERAFASVGHAMSRTWYRQRTGLSPDALVDAAAAEDDQLTDKKGVQALAARHFVDLVEQVRCNERVADVALRGLGYGADDCVAYEDTDEGLTAAGAAGIRLGIGSDLTAPGDVGARVQKALNS